MSDAHEVGRITDSQGRTVIVGVYEGMVTLRTMRTGALATVQLAAYAAEELGQFVVSAAWQAGWQAGKASAGGAAS